VIHINHGLLKLGLVLSPVVLHLVDFTKLSNSLKEFISRACLLWLEESKPEHLGIEVGAKSCVDVLGKRVVDDVFEVNIIKLISPWMENLEAFMVHVLLSKSLNIFLDEDEISLICLDWIAEIVLINSLLVVSQE